jgi:phytoene synthase
MTTAGELRSGKTHRDENFPVASWIIHPRHRALILAFYNFVRTADDIADHAALDAQTKLKLLDELEADLLGQAEGQREAVVLRNALVERGMPPRHARDLLTAFRMDVTKLRYEDWDDLIHYCSYSAMPVGRFVLDVHGESTATWPASDAVCAALQINNHLQDCGKDFRELNRVYIPRDALARHGASIEELGSPRASAGLLSCLHALAEKNQALLREGDALELQVADGRVACEIAVIQAYARQIVQLLKARSLERTRPPEQGSHGRLQPERHCGRDLAPRDGRRAAIPIDAGRMNEQMTSQPATFQGSASGSSFYAAMRILPRAQREAMFQIYSFCRQVDDIADSDGPRGERLAALQQWRDDIDALYRGQPPARLRDYAASVQKLGLKREDFLAIVDGMEMDVPADIRAPDLATLDLYCDRVASAVGRLSVRVFGLPQEDGILLAHHLGRALQLTNILRDIDEDAGIGRLYLPLEGLLHAGITSTDPQRVIADPALPKVCAPLVTRARTHFEKADEVMDRNPRRTVRAPRIMSKYYRAILELLVARGFALPRTPVRLNKVARIAILLRYAFI